MYNSYSNGSSTMDLSLELLHISSDSVNLNCIIMLTLTFKFFCIIFIKIYYLTNNKVYFYIKVICFMCMKSRASNFCKCV